MRRLLAALALGLAVVASPAHADDWPVAPGGEALIEGAGWECPSSEHVSVRDGVLTLFPTDGYRSPLLHLGPHLRLSHPDASFAVQARLRRGTDEAAALTLTGRLPRGDWWEKTKRLEVGFRGDRLYVAHWLGEQEATSLWRSWRLPAGHTWGEVLLEVRRDGPARELLLSVDGAELGRIEDPGLFPDDIAHLGVTVGPGNRLEVRDLRVLAPAGDVRLERLLRAPGALPPQPLRLAADAGRKQLGVNVQAWTLEHDREYRDLVGAEFTALGGAGEFHFPSLQPQAGRMRFCETDALVEFAAARGLEVFGAPLVGQWWLPDWLREEAPHLGAEQLEVVLEDHIRAVVGRYRGRVQAWEVVQAGIDWAGKPRDSVWSRGLGAAYVHRAYAWAHAADPAAALYYGDFAWDGRAAHARHVLRLIQDLRGRGIPVRGYALHLEVNPARPIDLARLRELFRTFGAAGVEVRLMDVRVPLAEGGRPSAAALEQQAGIFAALGEVCRAESACGGLSLAGLSDRQSGATDTPLLRDAQYRSKPAHAALLQALQGGR